MKDSKKPVLWPTPRATEIRNSDAHIAERTQSHRKGPAGLTSYVEYIEGRIPQQESNQESLISSALDSPARICPSQESKPVSTESVQDYLMKSFELLATFEPTKDTCPSSCWKTLQHSLLATTDSGLDTFSEGFPKSLVIQVEAGSKATLYRLGALMSAPAHRTEGNESGSQSWPTPNTLDSMKPKSPEALMREATEARPGRARPANLRDCVQPESMEMWPTPRSADFKGAANPSDCTKRRVEIGQANLPEFVMETDRRVWPTPTQSDYKGSGPTVIRKDGKDRTNDRLDYATEQTTDKKGQLNPAWVCWLMGLPLNYLDIDGWQNPELEGLPPEYLSE